MDINKKIATQLGYTREVVKQYQRQNGTRV